MSLKPAIKKAHKVFVRWVSLWPLMTPPLLLSFWGEDQQSVYSFKPLILWEGRWVAPRPPLRCVFRGKKEVVVKVDEHRKHSKEKQKKKITSIQAPASEVERCLQQDREFEPRREISRCQRFETSETFQRLDRGNDHPSHLWEKRPRTSEEKKMGICACSAGNHAQGVAYSANALDISVPGKQRGLEKVALEGQDSTGGRVFLYFFGWY